MACYIGVDGGGTKTHYALFDEQKTMLADCKTAGSNHENLEGGFDETVDILWQGLTALTAKAGMTRCIRVSKRRGFGTLNCITTVLSSSRPAVFPARRSV